MTIKDTLGLKNSQTPFVDALQMHHFTQQAGAGNSVF